MTTYSKVRVNWLVGDVVGNVLDLGVVGVGRGHVGSSRQLSNRGGKVVAGGRNGAGDASSTDGGRAAGGGGDEARGLESELLGGGSQAAVDSRHGHCRGREGREDN